MMKKYILSAVLVGLLASAVYSQNAVGVGVGTENPLGVFHVDPNKDTQSQSQGISDDVVVTEAGNVGVGTANPQAKLDVVGKISISGNEKISGTVTTDKLNVTGNLRIGVPNQGEILGLKKLEIFSAQPAKGLRIDDGSLAKVTDPTRPIPVMQSDGLGGMSWVNLPRRGEAYFRTGEINASKRIGGYGGGNNTDVTITPLMLSQGTWLIMAQVTGALNNTNLKTEGFALYIKLFKDGVSNPLAVNGTTSELNGAGVASPQMSYIVKVTGVSDVFRIGVSTSITSSGYSTTADYGMPFFFAMKLD